MLNNQLKLNPKLFDKEVDQVPIRNGFGEGLVLAGDANKDVVGLCADLVESTRMQGFAEKYPERFVEMGVAEQNLVTVASGMAAMGKIPFTSSYAMFSPGRNWEQIRTTICYNDRPVIIVGSHAGISVGPDGGTHQAIEDLALMRVLPNMQVISPCDAIEARRATLALARSGKPGYLRLAREKTPVITTEETPFEIGKAQVFYDSTSSKGTLMPILAKGKGENQVLIVATGALVYKALKVAEKLKEEVGIIVINLSSIKPFDKETVLAAARRVTGVVTVEEHQVAGGMGSAVAEFLAENHPLPIEFLGIKDKFGQSGTPEELLEHYGVGESHLEKAVKRVLKRSR
jgi:transketolase